MLACNNKFFQEIALAGRGTLDPLFFVDFFSLSQAVPLTTWLLRTPLKCMNNLLFMCVYAINLKNNQLTSGKQRRIHNPARKG